MIPEIRLYIEGGGDQAATKARFRSAFSTFFEPLRNLARKKKIKWNIVMCGGRESTFDLYKTALKNHPEAFNILLVDSEGPIKPDGSPWEYLKNRDDWDKPEEVEDKHCHLMVQMMET